MLGMGYELITRYEVEVREPLDLMTTHALSELALATEGLIRATGASRHADFLLSDDDFSPVLAGVPDVPSEFHAERVRPKTWFVATYLPTVQRRPQRTPSMNYAAYSFGTYPAVPHLADLGRYFFVANGTSGNKTRVSPRQLTSQAVLKALIPAIEILRQHYEGMDGHWKVT